MQWFTTDPDVSGADFAGQPYVYDNTQQAGTIWYHDHAMGITRLNVYAGLAGFYIVHDANEQSLVASHFLPAKPYDIPLAIQDRMFDTNGQLYYPADPLGNTDPALGPVDTAPSVHPEFFGDTILVNGKAWPTLTVEPRMYRFRVLDGSQARFYNLSLSNGLPIYQVGTDDGLLPAVVKTNQLLIAPGERADIVIDFRKMAGKTITLQNLFGDDMEPTPAPFPSGDPANDFGGSVGQIMQFVVAPKKSKAPDVVLLATKNPTKALSASLATKTRDVALFETTDEYGRLIQELGTPQNGMATFMDTMTANPALNDPADTVQLIRNKDGTQSVVEIWRIFNTTMDVHPIHLHQVSFQVLSRQKFASKPKLDANGVPLASQAFTYGTYGGVLAPSVNEARAWKDTVQTAPGEITTIIAKFDLPGDYVWHCHILEHEEHDMMHMLHVLPAPVPGNAVVAMVQSTATPTVAPKSSSTTTAGLAAVYQTLADEQARQALLASQSAAPKTTQATDQALLNGWLLQPIV